MSAYTSLARFYDSLTTDVPYGEFADFYESLFTENGKKVKTILDLACGTGAMTYTLAKRGYELIGVDSSAEMLSVAAQKSSDLTPAPLFICQSLQRLDLYGTVDAAVCTLDGINYIRARDLPKAFRRVRLFLEQGGLFVFDIIAPQKLRSMDGGVFIDETDDVFCVWRAEFSDTENACRYGIDAFEKSGRLWARVSEEHTEYAHSPDTLRTALKDAGFADVQIYGNLTNSAPSAEDGRIFFAAK